MTDPARLDELRARIAQVAAKAPVPRRRETANAVEESVQAPDPRAARRRVSTHLHAPADMARDGAVQRCAACDQEWVLLVDKRGPHLFIRDYRGDYDAVPFGRDRRGD